MFRTTSYRQAVRAVIVAVGCLSAAATARAQVFDPAFNAATNGAVNAVALQSDGKIVIGGEFTHVNNVAHRGIARLNSDGSLDAAFTTTMTVGFEVRSVAIQSDGKILLAGWFSEIAGVTRANIARLLPDGSVDPSFTASVTGPANQAHQVLRLLIEPDGRILVGGNIWNVNGVGRSNLARLNADGTIDGAFAPTPDNVVVGITRLNDGRILIAGAFEHVNGVVRTGVARLNAGGTLDTTFAPTLTKPFGPAPVVTAIRADGRILVGGQFLTANGQTRTSLAQLHADGSLDETFDVPITMLGGAGWVASIVVQPDDRVLIGGNFDRVGPIYSYIAARLQSNHAYDFSFGSLQGDWNFQTINDMALQPDGKVITVGAFGLTNVARLLAESPTPVNGDLRITATATPEPVSTGGTLAYTLTVTNVGTHPVSGVTVADTLPAGVTFAYCNPFNACGGSDNNRTLTFPSLAAGASLTMTIGATVTAGPGSTIVNTATVTSLTPDLASANNSVTVTSHTPAPPSADLQVTMTASPEPVATSGTLTYTVTVLNNGPQAASTVVVQDTLSAGLTFLTCVASGGTCSGSGGARTISYASIGAGQTRTIVLTAQAPATASATIVNTATVSSATTDGVPGNNTASATSHTPAAPPSPEDVDGDTLPNDWETRFGLDPNASTGDSGRDGDPDADGSSNVQELAAGTHPRGFVTRFLAEGARNAFFDVRIALLNVGTQPARLLRRFLQPGGTTVTQYEELAPGRRRTLTSADLSDLSSPDFSTVIESDQPLVIDRTMSWDASGYGSHAEIGTPSPATTWYLAEGSTSGDFALFYLIQNPNPTATTATVRYLLPFGQAPVIKTYDLAPFSRTTIPVDDQGGEVASTDVSAVITAPVPIIVERAMYKSTPRQLFAAGHGSAGVTAPSTHWFLAEGATGPFFDCFLLLANPGDVEAAVTVEYLLSDGTTHVKSYTVPANGRFTIWVDDEQIPDASGIRPLENVAVSSTVTSSVPIIVERTMWWPGPGVTPDFWTEAHNSPGATATGTSWALAEGEVGGTQSAETYILIANTSPTDGSARVTLYFEDGTSVAGTFELQRRSRLNVNVSVDFPSAVGRRFGAVVESLGDTPAQIVVERAMYTSPGGVVWAAGTNALAARLR